MQQALLKCEMTRLELKSSRSFLAIKCCQQTKSKKVIHSFKLPSSAHAWWDDACAVWLHNSNILGWAALGEAAKMMEHLTNKTADWL